MKLARDILNREVQTGADHTERLQQLTKTLPESKVICYVEFALGKREGAGHRDTGVTDKLQGKTQAADGNGTPAAAPTAEDIAAWKPS